MLWLELIAGGMSLNLSHYVVIGLLEVFHPICLTIPKNMLLLQVVFDLHFNLIASHQRNFPHSCSEPD